MATSLLPDDVLAFKVITQDAEQVAITTFHYHIVSVGTPAGTDADFNTGLEGVIASNWKALINGNATFKGSITSFSNRVPRPVAVIETGSAGAGTGGANALPRQASGLFSLQTAFAGRKFRGRNYIPFPSTTDDAATGIPGAPYLTKLT